MSIGFDGSAVITVHPERRRPGTCHLGHVTAIDPSAKRFELLELSPDAVWDDEPTGWRFRDVTRIDIGCGYAAALEELAGSPRTRHAPDPQPSAITRSC